MSKEKMFSRIEEVMGAVPNLLKEMSASPAAPLAYVEGQNAMKSALLNDREQQVVQLVTSRFNECHYCSNAHSTMLKGLGVSNGDINLIWEGELPKDEKLSNVAYATKLILEKKGHVTEADLKEFADMGLGKAELSEIIVHIGLKFISNYAVHVINPEIDDFFIFDREAK